MSKNSCDWQPDSTGGFSCEWQPDQQQARSEENSSALYKFKDNFSWEGITTEAYKPEGASFANILRNVIIGGHGESCLFDLRYFEVEKGGYSSLEKHGHEHVVICVRGK